MKKTPYVISSFLFGLLIILVLYLQHKKTEETRNNFQRKLLTSDSLKLIKTLDLSNNGYYIAGATNKQIYLSNYVRIEQLLTIDLALKDTQYTHLNIPWTSPSTSDNLKLRLKSEKITIDSPMIFLSVKSNGQVFYGKMIDHHFKKRNFSVINFSALLPISASNFLLKSFDHSSKQNILLKASTNPSSPLDTSRVLKKQVDGFFCTDGTLLYNEYLKQILYVYRYRNQFIGLDTTLNELYLGSTIDTVHHASIKLQTLSNKNKTLVLRKSNSREINKYCTTYKDLLFIQSGLIADNEEKTQFKQNSVIDVYYLTDQSYKFSFYLPDYNHEKVQEFRILGDTIFALYRQCIITYQLHNLSIKAHSQFTALDNL